MFVAIASVVARAVLAVLEVATVMPGVGGERGVVHGVGEAMSRSSTRLSTCSGAVQYWRSVNSQCYMDVRERMAVQVRTTLHVGWSSWTSESAAWSDGLRGGSVAGDPNWMLSMFACASSAHPLPDKT